MILSTNHQILSAFLDSCMESYGTPDRIRAALAEAELQGRPLMWQQGIVFLGLVGAVRRGDLLPEFRQYVKSAETPPSLRDLLPWGDSILDEVVGYLPAEALALLGKSTSASPGIDQLRATLANLRAVAADLPDGTDDEILEEAGRRTRDRARKMAKPPWIRVEGPKPSTPPRRDVEGDDDSEYEDA